jgi:hypothetical protein
MLNAVTQGFNIQDSTGTNWIYFIYNINTSTHTLGLGFQATYSLGMGFTAINCIVVLMLLKG